MTAYHRVPGRGWAYTGIVLGGLVSIAANITHTFLPPVGETADWRPAPMAVVFAISWPVFLFVAVEMLARTPWPRNLSFALVRWVGLLPVGIVAAAVSYRHLSGLLTHYGEERFVALIGPLAVDGLMVMATGALIATGRTRNPAPAPVAVPAAPGAVAATPTPIPPIGTSTPAVAAAPASPPAPVPAPVAPSPTVVAARISPSRPASTPAIPVPVPAAGIRTTRPRPSNRAAPASTLAPSTIDIPVTASDAAQLSLPMAPPEQLARAAQVARDYHTQHGTPITPGQLAVRLKVTSEQATHLLATLDNTDTPTSRSVNGKPAKATR